MNQIPKIGPLRGLEEIPTPPASKAPAGAFAEALKDAVRQVDDLQRGSEAAQEAWASGEPVALHDVLIKVGEAEVAFRAMMEVRNKLLSAYQDIMRMGSGG